MERCALCLYRSNTMDDYSIAKLSIVSKSTNDTSKRFVAISKIRRCMNKHYDRLYTYWVYHMFRYVSSRHAFPWRMDTNAPLSGHDVFTRDIQMNMGCLTCACGSSLPKHAIYSASGCKMVKSSPSLTFMCKNCFDEYWEEEGEFGFGWFEPWYHEPVHLSYRNYKKIYNMWTIVFAYIKKYKRHMDAHEDT